MLELDAFTGAILSTGFGMFTFCEHNADYNLLTNIAEPDWELITDYIKYSVLLPEGEQYRRFDLPSAPQPTPEPSPMPRP